MTIPALSATPVQPYNSTINESAFPKTLAFQTSGSSMAAEVPVKKAPQFIRMKGKSVEVKFTRSQNTVIMRSVPQGEVLGKAPASQGFMRALEAGSIGSRLVQTGQAAGTVAAVGEGGVALGFLVTAGLVLVTAGAVLFGKTDDLTNKEPDLRTPAQKQRDVLKGALKFAGIKLVGHPELLEQLQKKLGRNEKPFIARANQLLQSIKEGRIKPDNASAILRAELEVRYLKQGNDTNADIKLPQAPSPSPNVNQPKRKFTLSPVPDVPPLSSIVVKSRVVVKVAELPAPHDANIDEQLKKLAQTHQRDVFKIEDIDELAKTYGVSKEAIRAARNGGESLQQTAARLAAARFEGATGGVSSTGRARQKTITQRAIDILKADRRVVLEWLSFLPREVRQNLPDAIKRAIRRKLKESSSMPMRVRIRQNFGRPSQRRTRVSSSRAGSPAQEQISRGREKPLTKEMQERFKQFNKIPYEYIGTDFSNIPSDTNFRAIDPTLSDNDIGHLKQWTNHSVAQNATLLVKLFKDTKNAIKGTYATLYDVQVMFYGASADGVVNLDAAINNAIALAFALHESPQAKKIVESNTKETYLRGHLYYTFEKGLNPRQIVDEIIKDHIALRKHCKEEQYVNEENIRDEAKQYGITLEQAAKNWNRTRQIMINNGYGTFFLNDYNGQPYLGIEEEEVQFVNQDRIKNGLTPKQAVEKYRKANGYE